MVLDKLLLHNVVEHLPVEFAVDPLDIARLAEDERRGLFPVFLGFLEHFRVVIAVDRVLPLKRLFQVRLGVTD